MLTPWKKSYDKPRQHIKKQRHYFANKGLSSQSYSFSRSHVWMWELDHKEHWEIKNWCFWTVLLEKTLESPLEARSDQSIIGRIFTEAKALILWLPDSKSRLLRKDPDAGKDWRQEEKGRTEEEMVGCHHQINGHEFEQALGDGERQESLAWCNPWGESDTTEGLSYNWTTRTHLPMQEMQESRVDSLSREDPLEESIATDSSIPAWRIPWTEELTGLQSMDQPRLKQLHRQDLCLGVFSPTMTLLSPLLIHTSLWNTFLYPTLYFGSTICCLFPEGKIVLLPVGSLLLQKPGYTVKWGGKKIFQLWKKRWA